MNCAIHTITNPQVIRCYTENNILTFINWTCFIYCSNDDSTIYAIAYLHVVYICIDVDVTIFATYYSHILILQLLWFFDGDTFIKTVDVYYGVLRFMWCYYLAKPINNNIHVHFNLVISVLEEWR